MSKLDYRVRIEMNSGDLSSFRELVRERIEVCKRLGNSAELAYWVTMLPMLYEQLEFTRV